MKKLLYMLLGIFAIGFNGIDDIRNGEDITVQDEDQPTVTLFASRQSIGILDGCDDRRVRKRFV